MAMNQRYRKREAAVASLQTRLGVVVKKVGSAPANQGSVNGLNSPEDVLKTLIFPWLEHMDLIKPVCKLWSSLSMDSDLWKGTYSRLFSYPSKLFLLESDDPDWKELFAKKYRARTRNALRIGDGGHICVLCPVPGCDAICGSKIDYDHHLLGHEEEYLLHCIKARKKRGRSTPKRTIK